MPTYPPEESARRKELRRIKHNEHVKLYSKTHRSIRRAIQLKSDKKHRDRLMATRKAWESKNKDRLKATQKAWRDANKDKIKINRARFPKARMLELQRNYRRKNRLLKTNTAIGWRLRIRLLEALKGNRKSANAIVLLGCSIELFRLYIQNQFRDGMAWNNHGSVWHIDHIRPCASFDLSKPEEQAKCFHHTNMQPLLVAENMKKGARYEPAI